VLVTHLHSNAPQVSVETGRKMVPNEHMPSFVELEEAVQSVQASCALPVSPRQRAMMRGRATTLSVCRDLGSAKLPPIAR
jgi:hypothetical protein